MAWQSAEIPSKPGKASKSEKFPAKISAKNFVILRFFPGKCPKIGQIMLNWFKFSGSKPGSNHNDYRPDPTGGRGGADRIRSEHNGRNGNGLQHPGSGPPTLAAVAAAAGGPGSNSPAHLGPSGPVMMPTQRNILGQIVVALYTYQGSEFGDMSFKKGDMMEIVDNT